MSILRMTEEQLAVQNARLWRRQVGPGAEKVESIARLPEIPAKKPPIYPLIGLCRAAGLPEPVPEYQFHPTRKWRADYCWPHTNPKVLLEIDGAVWAQGRHTRGSGFIEDQVKLNAAALLGYIVLRYTPDRLVEAIADLRVLFGRAAA